MRWSCQVYQKRLGICSPWKNCLDVISILASLSPSIGRWSNLKALDPCCTRWLFVRSARSEFEPGQLGSIRSSSFQDQISSSPSEKLKGLMCLVLQEIQTRRYVTRQQMNASSLRVTQFRLIITLSLQQFEL